MAARPAMDMSIDTSVCLEICSGECLGAVGGRLWLWKKSSSGGKLVLSPFRWNGFVLLLIFGVSLLMYCCVWAAAAALIFALLVIRFCSLSTAQGRCFV